MKRARALAVRAAVVAAIALGLVLMARHLDVRLLRAAIASATLWPIVLAALLSFVCLWCKAAAWRIMLGPDARVGTLRLFRYTIVAFAASALAPARAGEVVRVWLLKRRDGVPASDAVAVALAERLLDAVAMVVMVAPLPWLLPGLPPWIGRAILVCGGVALAAFVGLTVAVRRVGPVDPASAPWWRRTLAGMHVLGSPRRLLGALGFLLLVWIVDLGEVTLCLYAVGISLPWPGALLVLLTLNLLLAVPSTPGQVGALELGALIGTDLMGVPREPALAFALIYHVMQLIPLIVVGLALEFRLVLGREPEVAAFPTDQARPKPDPAKLAPSPRTSQS